MPHHRRTVCPDQRYGGHSNQQLELILSISLLIHQLSCTAASTGCAKHTTQLYFIVLLVRHPVPLFEVDKHVVWLVTSPPLKF